MKRLLIHLFTFILCSTEGFAQSLPDVKLSADFKAEVKSLDEFKARFNGTESKPGIKNDINFRRNNIISLFDFKMKRGNLSQEDFIQKINDFADSIITNNIEFKVSDAGLWAECICRMQYKGKKKNLTLILQSESYKDGMYRWAIVGVKGLKEIGVLNTEKYYAISPAEHEIHFLGLQDYLNANSKQAFGYRYRDAKIDPLSVFLTMICTGIITFDVVEKQTFHYYDIPGYIVTINELSRQGDNSGWLITSFDKVSEREKIERLNKLLGNE